MVPFHFCIFITVTLRWFDMIPCKKIVVDSGGFVDRKVALASIVCSVFWKYIDGIDQSNFWVWEANSCTFFFFIWVLVVCRLIIEQLDSWVRVSGWPLWVVLLVGWFCWLVRRLLIFSLRFVSSSRLAALAFRVEQKNLTGPGGGVLFLVFVARCLWWFCACLENSLLPSSKLRLAVLAIGASNQKNLTNAERANGGPYEWNN